MGFSGMVVRALSAGQRVQILLDFLGRVTLTEVDRRSLKLENRRVADLLPLLATRGDPADLPPRVNLSDRDSDLLGIRECSEKRWRNDIGQQVRSFV